VTIFGYHFGRRDEAFWGRAQVCANHLRSGATVDIDLRGDSRKIRARLTPAEARRLRDDIDSALANIAAGPPSRRPP